MHKDIIVHAIKEAYMQVINNDEDITAQEKARLVNKLPIAFKQTMPLSTLGWDSLKLTWFMVRLEEQLDIDTSSISMYNLHTFADLIEALNQKMSVEHSRG